MATTSPNRLVSLDVFRGITIAGMTLVNNPGTWSSIYWPLEHAEWNGWTPTDLVFPFFLFIVGVAIPLALGRRIENGSSRRSLLFKICKRANHFPARRVPGRLSLFSSFHDPRSRRAAAHRCLLFLCFANFSGNPAAVAD